MPPPSAEARLQHARFLPGQSIEGVWLGDQYTAAQGDAYVTAAEVTDQVNTVIKNTASTTGSAYVDLRAAF